MAMRYSVPAFFLFLLFCLLAAPLPEALSENKESSERVILITSVNGVINPVAAEQVGSAVRKAGTMKAEALLIELDTPGGLDTSMRAIVKEIIGSPVPVIVYVSPSGARAASAGVFITLAAHVAAMAPGTNIGAAHPVAVGEKMDKVMSEKATNDAAAYIKSIAEQRARNAQWAENAVRKSVSVTETEALKLNIIDLVARDLGSLFSEINGKTVRTVYGDRKINTNGARTVREESGLRRKILNLISDPTVAYLLMLLGFYGIFFELTNPGALFPGIVGGICIILAFYAFQTLPINYAGLLLIILGIILFILEVKVTSHGALTIGGIIALFFGSLMLFDTDSPAFRLSLSVIIPVVLITSFFFALTVRLAVRAMKRKPVTGAEGMLGAEGTATSDFTGQGGMVSVHGEIWKAWSEEPVKNGDPVVVTEMKGLRLKIRKSPLS